MKTLTLFFASGLILCLPLLMPGAQPQTANSAEVIEWKNALKQKPEWYASYEAIRIADNLLLYQRDSGGWPKNIDMSAVLSAGAKTDLVKQKRKADSTIDNGATYIQLGFLARIYETKKIDRYRQAFLKGVDYLLRAQYANGGWPQSYPLGTNYSSRITFNDNAMIGVMTLLRDLANRKSTYHFVDEDRRARAKAAVRKGVECILRTQVKVRGQLTAWGAQHDEITLAPAAARKFEPVSLASAESVGIVLFLMKIENPKNGLAEAIESAIRWFEKSKISGVRWVKEQNASIPGGVNHLLIKDASAGFTWARFYEIGTDRPIFSGRDGVIKYDVAEIELERRNGYQWYVTTPAELLNEDYPRWKNKWRP